MGGLKYEGLPPEVGAFNSEKWVHAPWPVHNFHQKWPFFDVFRIRGVGVIPWRWEGFEWVEGCERGWMCVSRGWFGWMRLLMDG